MLDADIFPPKEGSPQPLGYGYLLPGLALTQNITPCSHSHSGMSSETDEKNQGQPLGYAWALSGLALTQNITPARKKIARVLE